MSPTSYVVPKAQGGGVLKNAVSKILTVSSDNSETVRDRTSVTIRLVPTSITVNDLERRNGPYFAFFSPNSIPLQADYVTVGKTYNVRKILSCSSSLSLLTKTNAPCSAVSLR